ncbi:MAG: metallophosphoesterase [Candidatus Aminicenantes bacterium]|nr:metallophosphoesterase [Candidatus Aminicenantes bacterium]
MLITARFLLPNLGHPFFIPQGEKSFCVRIASGKELLSGQDLEGSFYLKAVGRKRFTLPLKTVSVDVRKGLDFDTPLKRVLSGQKQLSFFNVKLAISAQESELDTYSNKFLMFNLHHPKMEPSFHSVVLLFHNWERYRFCFITDTHVAEVWDKIQNDLLCLPSEGEETRRQKLFSLSKALSGKSLRDNFINPNSNLVHFIKKANTMSSNGELDFVIAGGDLVDYKFKKYRKLRDASYSDTNVELFEKIITGRYEPDVELQVPLWTVAGNHDYRLYPYEIRNYGLEHCGLHAFQTDFFLKSKNEKNRRSFTVKDLRSVLGITGRKHSLDHYFIHFNPMSDFSFNIKNTRFICVDSGRDAFLNAIHTHILRFKNLIKAILNSWHFPDSEGLSDRQVRFVQKEADKEAVRNVVLIFHAGLINTHFDCKPVNDGSKTACTPVLATDASRELLFPLMLKDHLHKPAGLKRNVSFENTLKRLGLNYGCLFKNQLSLLEMASEPHLNFLGLSGHNHRNIEIRLEKDNGYLYTKDYARGGLEYPFDESDSYFFCGNSLAHVQPRYATPNNPGYYEISAAGDTLVKINRQSLNAGTHEKFSFFAGKAGDPSCPSKMEIRTEIFPSAREDSEDTVHLIVSFVVGARRKSGGRNHIPINIRPDTAGQVLLEDIRWISDEEKGFFPGKGKRKPMLCHSFLCRPAPVLSFSFSGQDAVSRKWRVAVIGEFVREDENRFQSLRLCWHPCSFSIYA